MREAVVATLPEAQGSGVRRGLQGRDAELAAIASFATGSSGFMFLVGAPFSGKTTLLKHAVAHGLPDNVDVVSCFLRREASEADSDYFLAAVVPQLEELCSVYSSHPPNIHWFRYLWAIAAEQALRQDRHLLLVVDGLDEDPHPKYRPSVAGILPEFVAGRVPEAECAHVLVTSRTSDLPLDRVALDSYPQSLQATERVQLDGFPGWEDRRDLGLAEVNEVFMRGDEPRKLLSLMATVDGPISALDLATMYVAPKEATREDGNTARRFLEGRSFQRVGTVAVPRYGFAHPALREHAQRLSRVSSDA